MNEGYDKAVPGIKDKVSKIISYGRVYCPVIH
jgi:hypothetical protein